MQCWIYGLSFVVNRLACSRRDVVYIYMYVRLYLFVTLQHVQVDLYVECHTYLYTIYYVF